MEPCQSLIQKLLLCKNLLKLTNLMKNIYNNRSNDARNYNPI